MVRAAGTEGLKGAKAADGSTNVCRTGKDEKKGHTSVPYGDESRVFPPQNNSVFF